MSDTPRTDAARLKEQESLDPHADFCSFECEKLESELNAANEKLTALQSASKALVKKIKQIHEDSRYQSVWVLAAMHGSIYDGPNYASEFEALEKELSK